jgi:hypothetical protein
VAKKQITDTITDIMETDSSYMPPFPNRPDFEVTSFSTAKNAKKNKK